MKASEDRDMWIRAAARHSVFRLDRVVLLKRDHGANMSRAARQQTACIQQVLAKAFASSDLKLTARDHRLAKAVCYYQSALMYADAGDHGMAALQMISEVEIPPWLTSGGRSAGTESFARSGRHLPRGRETDWHSSGEMRGL